MKLASMLRRLRNTQGGGARSAARSRSTPYTPYTNGPFGPVAHAGSDQTVSVKTKVYFDGSGSTDPDGGNLYYSWAFGAGAKPATGRGVKPSCTYTTTGDKTVTLTVRDDRGVESDVATLTVTVISMASKVVEDGKNVDFEVLGPPSVLDADTTTFSWDWDYQKPAGNDPDVSFSSLDSKTTTINEAKWYAFPDVICSPRPSPPPDPFITSTYTIRCTVTTPNGSATAEAKLSVMIPEEGGRTLSPTLANFTFDNQSGNSQMPWRLNPNSIRREDAEVIIKVDENSQFYDKLVAHENRHVEQWKAGWKSNYFTADKFLNFVTNSGVTVRNLKSDIVEDEKNDAGDIVREGLRTLVGRAYRNWYIDEFNAATRELGQPGVLQAAERDAYSMSDQVSPHYYYEGVCRGY